ncbi:MAG: pilus assembly protein [Acidobacteria bacterium]|nr:pilus assembly protein [Acidobacteriota bacterium]
MRSKQMITKFRGRRGNSIVEFALIAPLLLMMLHAGLDLALYAYAFLSVENAARAAALRNSGGLESATDQAAACAMTLESLRGLPSIGSASAGNCSGSPLTVTSQLCDARNACSIATPAGEGATTVVAVTYRMPELFRFPLGGTGDVRRICQMRVGGAQ